MEVYVKLVVFLAGVVTGMLIAVGYELLDEAFEGDSLDAPWDRHYDFEWRLDPNARPLREMSATT